MDFINNSNKTACYYSEFSILAPPIAIV